jgi:hypothetical protein
MASFPIQSAIAAVLKSRQKNMKKKAMEDTLDKARAKGYNVEINIDPETGKSGYKLSYKGKSQSDMVKDKFDVAKMLSEMKKWEREEGKAKEGEEFNLMAELGFGGGAQDLARKGVSGQFKDKIKEALRMKGRYRGAGQTLLRDPGGGFERVKIPGKTTPKKLS